MAALLLCASFALSLSSEAALLGAANVGGSADSFQQGAQEAPEQEIVNKAFKAAELAETAAKQAEDSAGEADRIAKEVPMFATQAEPAEKRAEEQLKVALDAEKAAEEISKSVEEEAYNAAKAEAQKEAAHLKSEAEGYYVAYLADLKLSEAPVLDKTAQAQAVADAKKPYLEAENKVANTVESYNSLAISLAQEVGAYTEKAKSLADEAVKEQSMGSTVLASQHMMQAHKLLYMAKERKARALKVRHLAENINDNTLPAYKQAAELAGDHAFSAFSGLQLALRHNRNLRHRDA